MEERVDNHWYRIQVDWQGRWIGARKTKEGTTVFWEPITDDYATRMEAVHALEVIVKAEAKLSNS